MNLKNLKISTIRCGNIIGGGDWSKFRLIPDYYRAYLSNKNLVIKLLALVLRVFLLILLLFSL